MVLSANSGRLPALAGCVAAALAVHALAPVAQAGALALFGPVGGLWLNLACIVAITWLAGVLWA